MSHTHEQLSNLFMRFPGIGRKQSERFVDFLVRQHPGYIHDLTTAIQSLQKHTKQCPVSHQYFTPTHPEQTTSPIELDQTRDRTTLMVLATDLDLSVIEQSRTYSGMYFVLGGMVPLAKNRSRNHLAFDALSKRIQDGIKNDHLGEIILAFSVNPQGDHTTQITKQHILPITEENEVKITILGRGLSTGSELEYLDADTVHHALRARTLIR